MSAKRSVRFSEDEIDQVARRYKQGETIAQLAEALSCSAVAISNALRMRGVTPRRPQHGMHPQRRKEVAQ